MKVEKLVMVEPKAPGNHVWSLVRLPRLGLPILGTLASRRGIDVRIFIEEMTPVDFAQVAEADLLCISTITSTAPAAYQLADRARAAGVPVIIGGPHVTFCARDTLNDFPELDVIVKGEGEETIVELARAAGGKQQWDAINGIAFRNGSEICQTADRDLVQDLDSLPAPARHLLALGRYRALGMPISLTTSRGCPFKCIFCVGRKMVGARVRYRNPVEVVNELEYLSTLNFNQINIADDLFTADKTHCQAVCDEIIKRGLSIKWTSFARVDTVSEKLLKKMKAAGCTAVSFGIESANSDILKTIKKGITLQQVVDAVEACNRAGVIPHASFILGLPGETPDTIKETMAFGERLKATGLSYGFHLLAPFPGTAVRDQSKAYGIQILTDDSSEYHANRAIVETPYVTKKMMDSSVVDWEIEYDRVLDGIKKRIDKGEATEEEAWSLVNLERTVLIYDLMMNSCLEDQGVVRIDIRKDKSTTAADKALSVLSDRISGTTKYTRKEIYDALKHTLEQGNLTYEVKNGKMHWRWIDYL